MIYQNKLGIEYSVELQSLTETIDGKWIASFAAMVNDVPTSEIVIAFNKRHFPSEEAVRLYCSGGDIQSALKSRLEYTDENGVLYLQIQGGVPGEWEFFK